MDNNSTKILYVEDDPTSEILVRRVLESEGFQVVAASDGLSAIEIAKNELPDLILMDINISGLDGYEVTTRLRTIEDLQEVPIVAVTAATLSGDRERALIAGCTGYIPKPIDVDQFPGQVRSFLEGTKEEIESVEEKAEYLVEYSHRLVDRLEAKIRELEKSNAELQRLDRMKTDFIIIAGHELRTPLTAIYGYAQILQTNPDIVGSSKEPGSTYSIIEKMTEATYRLNQVVGDILNVSLIDADKLDLSVGPVFLKSLVNQAVQDIERIGSDREITFKVEGLKGLPPIMGDSKQLYQALWNVITNAVKYTPDGGRVHIFGRQIENTIQIAIKDSGIGIQPEDHERIFDRFYILHDTALHSSSKTAFKGGGLGVGLTVARGIVEGHGGRIWVESKGHDEEKLPGSTFHILLPVGELG
ncbi:MAG: hybrid sensor histidine kinase/response regulator [Chloroflexota bacterium]|nr:hybrid sensor histidine kinase/response regulator [Chloroflexota bacterium]